MKSLRFLSWLAVFFGAAINISVAGGSAVQPWQPLELSVHQIPGIWITGINGPVSIEYTTNLDQASGWTLLASVKATNSPYFYIDETATNSMKRFYRATCAFQPLKLNIQRIPGIWISGATGGVNIDYTINPDQTSGWTLLANVKATNGAVSIDYNTNLDQTSGWALANVQAKNSPYLYIAATATAANAPYLFYRVVGPPHLAWIPPGTFTMGSPSTEQDRYDFESPPTQVTISSGFWMSKYETTQEEYLAVMGDNDSYFSEDVKRPMEQVTWNEATNYCAKLTAREHAAGRLTAVYAYRLPTEAEWEYACRAGTTTATAYGNSMSSSQANFHGDFPYNGGAYGPFLGRTTKVGSYAPNAWGLYDMHGNVWEWCLDWYGAYPGGSVTDPRGPNTGSFRVFRGGGWFSAGGDCRSAVRRDDDPSIGANSLGFRVALVQVP